MNNNGAKYISVPIHFNLVCTDTENWDDGNGNDCTSYVNWCYEGVVISEKEWSIGEQRNYPENNCCVCGKGLR